MTTINAPVSLGFAISGNLPLFFHSFLQFSSSISLCLSLSLRTINHFCEGYLHGLVFCFHFIELLLFNNIIRFLILNTISKTSNYSNFRFASAFLVFKKPVNMET